MVTDVRALTGVALIGTMAGRARPGAHGTSSRVNVCRKSGRATRPTAWTKS